MNLPHYAPPLAVNPLTTTNEGPISSLRKPNPGSRRPESTTNRKKHRSPSSVRKQELGITICSHGRPGHASRRRPAKTSDPVLRCSPAPVLASKGQCDGTVLDMPS